MSVLRPVTRGRLYQQLVDQLVEFIRHEGLSPGCRLPSERTLAELLGVSRNTLKQAILVLEVQGIIEVRHGGGTYLLRRADTAESVATLAERRARLPDILDAREALETKVVDLAARRRSDDDLARIDAALAAMEAAVAAGEDPAEGDRSFHGALVDAAHSPVLAGLYRSLETAIAESRLESLRQPGRPARSLAQHRRIAAAVRDRSPAGAVRATRRHIDTVRQVRLLGWSPGEDSEPRA